MQRIIRTTNNADDPSFPRLYHEQNQQNSNVYFFACEQETIRTQKNHLRKKVFARVFFVSAALVAVFIFAGSVLRERNVGSPRVASYNALYNDVSAGYASFVKFNFQEARRKFNAVRQAEYRFQHAPSFFSSLAFLSSAVPLQDQPVLDKLARAAHVAAHAGESFLNITFSSLFGNTENGALSAGVLFAQSEQEIKNAKQLLSEAEKDAESFLQKDAPLEIKNRINAILSQLPFIKTQEEQFLAYVRLLAWAFSPEYSRKFLVVVQNQNRARATGGFIETYGAFTIERGALSRAVFDTAYNLDGQLQAKVIPPRQLQDTATSWSMRNANWFLDFPTSARAIADFYQKSGGGEVDGVIALNKNLLREIMRIVDPSASFAIMNEDAFKLIVEKIFALPADKLSAVLNMMRDALIQKNGIVWLADREYEKMIVAWGWGGAITSQADADYTAVALHMRDAEDKTHGPLKQDMLKHTKIMDNGDILNTVALELKEEKTASLEESGDTLYYVKLYVPKGSTLIAASGGLKHVITPHIDYAREYFMPNEDVYASESAFVEDSANAVQIFNESGKTVFGAWVNVGAESAKLLYHYTLPLSVRETKGVLTSFFQSQPGMRGTLDFSLALPEGKRLIASDDNAFSGKFSGDFVNDLSFTATIQ